MASDDIYIDLEAEYVSGIPSFECYYNEDDSCRTPVKDPTRSSCPRPDANGAGKDEDASPNTTRGTVELDDEDDDVVEDSLWQRESDLKEAELNLYDELVQTETQQKNEEMQHRSEYKVLCQEIVVLRDCVLMQEQKIAELTLQNDSLQKNICSLYKTAKSEIGHKDSLLSEANQKLDESWVHRKDHSSRNTHVLSAVMPRVSDKFKGKNSKCITEKSPKSHLKAEDHPSHGKRGWKDSESEERTSSHLPKKHPISQASSQEQRSFDTGKKDGDQTSHKRSPSKNTSRRKELCTKQTQTDIPKPQQSPNCDNPAKSSKVNPHQGSTDRETEAKCLQEAASSGSVDFIGDSVDASPLPKPADSSFQSVQSDVASSSRFPVPGNSLGELSYEQLLPPVVRQTISDFERGQAATLKKLKQSFIDYYNGKSRENSSSVEVTSSSLDPSRARVQREILQRKRRSSHFENPEHRPKRRSGSVTRRMFSFPSKYKRK